MGSFEKKQSEDYGSYGEGRTWKQNHPMKTRVQELWKVERTGNQKREGTPERIS